MSPRHIDLDGFEATFADNTDPWCTYTARDEANKRAAILRALGRGRSARVLELGSGNGSNSVALARRALYLHACDGTAAGANLTQAALATMPGARASRCALPEQFPRGHFDTIVVAELLYYLSPWQMHRLARLVARALLPGGRLVLAHHHIDFDDTSQTAYRIHRRWQTATGRNWVRSYTWRNSRWIVEGLTLPRGLA